MRDLSLYRASLLPTARRFLRPELDAPPASGLAAARREAGTIPGAHRAEPALRVLALTPSPSDLPDSSLVFMLGTLAEAWDDGGGGFFARPDWSLDIDALREAIGQAQEEGQPVLIAGTAFAYMHWLDMVRSSWLPPLPWGSRALETGGYKGRSREVPRHELHREIASIHGIAPDHIVNEYGMTELLSQFYEPVSWQGEPAQGESAEGESPGHLGPPWIRTRILDPVLLQSVRPGEVGLLAHFDLANLDSVSAVLTEDLGVQVQEGFRVLGRMTGSEPRASRSSTGLARPAASTPVGDGAGGLRISTPSTWACGIPYPRQRMPSPRSGRSRDRRAASSRLDPGACTPSFGSIG